MEGWKNGIRGRKTITMDYFTLTTQYSIVPAFPGPDLGQNALVIRISLTEYYSNNSIF